MRQSSPDATVLVRTNPVTFLHDVTTGRHVHEWDQFTFAAAGAMRVETSAGSWTVPAHSAVWVPRGVEHAERMYAGVSVRTLYFKRALTRSLARSCRTVNVPGLLRELILHVSRIGVLNRTVPSHARLAAVLLDELGTLTEIPLQLPLPRDVRALRFARLIEDSPSESASVVQLARKVGASRRTLERLFVAETRMSVGEWRRRLRLLHAVRLLVAGQPVTEVALEAGYSSVSAFIAVFRRTFGATPSRYRTLAPTSVSSMAPTSAPSHL